ncbi:MAG: helicase/exodeoxyribonuclease gamma subunit [Deltaproteobacteria bacterium]|nr:helicase/exodeoxyribonuclease gamma subunit [Deltaproteobacteria bacterium]
MHVHRSNRTETLLAELAAVVARPAGGPFDPECIVVQGKGMERWLAMELARRLGVWANPDFPFPRHLIERALTAVLGPREPETDCFTPDILLWAIAELLPRLVGGAEFAPIRRYLAREDQGLRRVQLAQRIADTFDQYLVYRPKMILDWDDGHDTHWQAVLWRALTEHLASRDHIAARARGFLDSVRATRPHLDGFPARVNLFGVSTLPPLYLDLLSRLSPWVELHLFVLSPTREYWGDIRSRRELLRRPPRRSGTGTDMDRLVDQAEGNPLLASMGRLGRDFQQLLEDAGDYQEDERDLYRDPGTRTMLAAVQSDILALQHRVAHGEVPPLALDPDDDSIRAHACHSPMREVEVLHDQLLALFDRDSTLEPHDVVVMSPDIDTYAPFVEAVFGRTGADRPRIPYRIADRHVRATEVVFDAFTKLLDTLRGRMTASDILDLLGNDVIGARFDLAGEELDRVRRWVADAGIRWGVDAEHREEFGQPVLPQNTWRFGLDRLLLGYAMPGERRTLFGGVLPYDDLEGTEAEALGRLADFCEQLFGFRSALRQPRSVAAWCAALAGLVDGMLTSTDAIAYQHQRIRDVLDELATAAERARFTEPIELDAVRAQLEQRLQRGATERGFLAGGVTFCAMVPMRTIPFRVLCLLGMNDGAFPRLRRPLGFDLMAQQPRPGDRSARDDDRYLFLEALLSARERLILTYVGQSIRDNAQLPPSVVVSELLDVLDESFVAAPPHPSASSRVCIFHALQSFSPAYFDQRDARLFSYDASACAGARSLVGPRQPAPAFLSAAMPPDGSAAPAVSLDDLVQFFDNPARALLQRRLGLHLGDDAPALLDREPIAPDALEQWSIGDDLLARTLEGDDLRVAFSAIKASGVLPLGTPGNCLYEELQPRVTALAASAVPLIGGTRLEPVVVDRTLGDGTRITGVLRNLWPAGQVECTYSKLGGTRELRLWIRHVILNWAAPESVPRASTLVGRPAKDDGPVCLRFRPVGNPEAILQQLVALYRRGQQCPLPFFPKSSRAYVEALLSSGGDERRASTDAKKKFKVDRHAAVPGDAEDPYVQQIFGNTNPLDPACPLLCVTAPLYDSFDMRTFAEIARAVFEPLLQHREDGTLS